VPQAASEEPMKYSALRLLTDSKDKRAATGSYADVALKCLPHEK